MEHQLNDHIDRIETVGYTHFKGVYNFLYLSVLSINYSDRFLLENS